MKPNDYCMIELPNKIISKSNLILPILSVFIFVVKA